MSLADFAATLQARRHELGRTKADVARRYGHDPAAIAFYERGQSRPQVFHVDALANAYSLPPNDLRRLLGYPLLPDTEPSPAARLAELEDFLNCIRRDVDSALQITDALRASGGAQ